MQFQARDRNRSLKDLAKLAGPPPPPKRAPGAATSESSGFIDLAAIEAADPTWLEKAIARAKAPSVHFESDVDLSELAPPRRSRRRRGVWLGLAVCLIAAGSAGFVFRARLRERLASSSVFAALPVTAAQQPTAPAAVAPPPPPIAPSIASASAAPSPSAAPAASAPSTDVPPSTRGADDAPPSAIARADGKKRHGHGASTRGTGAHGAAPLAAKLAAPSIPIPAAHGGGGLGDAIKNAAEASPSPAPPPKSAEPVAAAAAGSVPDRPSPAVVTSTLKGVLPAARACLAGDDAPARAVVTFASSGAVSNVQVSGAGPGVAACIKASIAKAKLAPFAQPTYTATLSVRPD
jgi:hypothetical protein